MTAAYTTKNIKKSGRYRYQKRNKKYQKSDIKKGEIKHRSSAKKFWAKLISHVRRAGLAYTTNFGKKSGTKKFWAKLIVGRTQKIGPKFSQQFFFLIAIVAFTQ